MRIGAFYVENGVKMEKKVDIKIVAIVALCVLEGIALIMEVDGAYLLPVAAAIAGLGGYEIRSLRMQREIEVLKRNGDRRG